MRARYATTALILALVAGCQHGAPEAREPAPVHISMADLHAAGGVPPGWHFRVPAGDVAAGRTAFFENECYTCHQVAGESFSDMPRQPGDVGPELSGMGAHHPPEYFAESILNPSAVVVDGPGYAAPSGQSIMPSYDGMSLQELTNLVAYICSLKSGGDNAAHDHMNHAVPAAVEAFAPAPIVAAAYFAQAYSVPSERLEAFYDWFEKGQARSVVGLINVVTYASRVHDGQHLIVSIFGFDGDATLQAFLAQRDATPASSGDFLHPVSEYSLRSEGLYHAVQMSFP